MPRKKLICPKCSSENAVKILYGEPTWEAELAADNGELFLGGCCFSPKSPLCICKDCKYTWGSNMESIDLMQAIEARIGGYFGSSISIEADIAIERLTYSCADYYDAENNVQFEKAITIEDWKKLIRGMRNCDFEYWLDEYADPGVCDGTQWSVRVGLSNGQYFEKFGSNQYPGKWKQFCKALSKIAGASFK